MPEAYSNDLRRKLLEAYEEGQGTLEELAERFSVSEGWAKKISGGLQSDPENGEARRCETRTRKQGHSGG